MEKVQEGCCDGLVLLDLLLIDRRNTGSYHTYFAIKCQMDRETV
jgi:hypothetical protein